MAAHRSAPPGGASGASAHHGHRAGARLRLINPPLRWWLLIGGLAALALRLPFIHSGLTRDEGGDTLIADAFRGGGPFTYGNYFLDRPPLLLALYGAASHLGADLGVRILGVAAAITVVVLVTLLAVRLAGAHAAPVAALTSAAMVSSQASGAEQTPAELLALVPSCGSLLLLVAGLQATGRARWRLAAAGAAAAAAVLVKQSFGDAALAGAAALLVTVVRRDPSRGEAIRRAGAFAAGLLAPLVVMTGWAVAARVPAHQLWYSMFGFRLQAVAVLAARHPAARLTGLLGPAWHSGVAVALVAGAVGIATAPLRIEIRAALVAWATAGLLGVLLSGGYFPPYVIELMPVAATSLALLATRRRVVGIALAAAVVGLAVLPTLRVAYEGTGGSYQADARTIGDYVEDHARPGDTAYVLYAQANVLYYSGLSSPFPYHWALMMQAIPGAQDRLRQILAGPGRPTWVIAHDSPTSFGLDRTGATARILRRDYRLATVVRGDRILLARARRS